MLARIGHSAVGVSPPHFPALDFLASMPISNQSRTHETEIIAQWCILRPHAHLPLGFPDVGRRVAGELMAGKWKRISCRSFCHLDCADLMRRNSDALPIGQWKWCFKFTTSSGGCLMNGSTTPR